MRPRFFAAVALGTLFAARTASAQTLPAQKGFALDRYEPAERGSEWFALDSLDLRGKIRPAIGVTTDWGYHPLVAYDQNGNYITSLVRNQLMVDPSASLVLFDRLRIGALMNIAAVENGHAVSTATATFRPPSGRLGDIRVGADVRLFGVHGDLITGAVGAALYIPSGTRESYTSDGNTRFAPRFSVAGDASYLTWSARAAFQYRPLTERFDRNELGSQVELGGAAGARLLDEKLVVGPEIFSSSVTNAAFLKRRGTPLEVLLGAHYSVKDLRFGVGVGSGILRGWGSPAFRGLLSVEWAPAVEPPKPPPPPPPPPVVVEPPPPPPPVVVPPPPPDRDGDGIVDAKDACPDVPGDASTDAMSNGCPADRDGDGIYDKDDACPDAAGAGDPDPKKNGCPLARIENGQIKIAEQVRFKTSSADILADSDTVLRAIASTLKTHPEINKVIVEGHTDNTGATQTNKTLSQKRAESVVAALIKFGVAKSRLSAKGLGSSQPLESNQTPDGRAANRRVELHIVKEM